LDSRETLKEAVAWLPQSLISDILKIGMLLVWREFEMIPNPIVRLHADMHDGLLMSVRADSLDRVVPHIKRLMTVPVAFPSGTMIIPVDFTIGYQWQKKLMPEWKPSILDTIHRPETRNLLDIEAGLFG
jgi:DNA polymerase I-like protein with 3'-5' exonuclease and polymerase domains